MNEMLKGIKAWIEFLYPSYDPNAIFQNYQNNMKLPDANFIMITEFDSRLQGLNQPSQYDGAKEIQSYAGTDETWFQVDFYGANARQMCSAFRITLTEPDATYFLNDGYSCTVGRVEEQKNLTAVLDRGKFLTRFLVRFSLFNNNVLSIGSLGFSNVNVDVILADVQ